MVYCNVDSLLEGCFGVRSKGPSRVALLIEGFPRPYHPMMEFAKLLFLLREHHAKATFVVDWQDIRDRGMGASVADMMRLLLQNEHEVAIRFRPGMCSASQLRQHAVEALHFLQRVYGVTVVSAKVGSRLPFANAALASLGVSVIDGVGTQHLVQDSDDVINDAEMTLRDLEGKECVRVSQLLAPLE